MHNSWSRTVLFGIGLSMFLPAQCVASAPDDLIAWRLTHEVQERERQLNRSERELSESRARLALFEWNRDLAITELRKAVACRRLEVQWIRDHANWFCDPREPMTGALWDLAKSSAWLAELEGDTATVVAQRRAIVGFHEERLRTARQLELLRAVDPRDIKAIEDAATGARKRLEAAEDQLRGSQKK